MVKSTIEESKAAQLIRKIINLKNLSKTMGDLIKNIVSEIDNSREEMFRILEGIAMSEIKNNPKNFKKQ